MPESAVTEADLRNNIHILQTRIYAKDRELAALRVKVEKKADLDPKMIQEIMVRIIENGRLLELIRLNNLIKEAFGEGFRLANNFEHDVDSAWKDSITKRKMEK